MDLLQEILLNLIVTRNREITLVDCAKVVEAECYQALAAIRAVMDDEKLSDSVRIEAVRGIMERIGDHP